jgi:acyl-CoA reductase-like NAD-dependent aldehyde dehydrogenase
LEAKRIGKGAVSLVLGAGNQTSIPILDAVHKLFIENQVVMLKHNPVSEWLYPIVDKVMEPLIAMDVLHHTKGGVDVGQYLTQQCDNVHITGSDKTHDAIVWGPGGDKKASEPKYKKEVTAELGCVTPCVIVPGQLTSSELTYLASHLTGGICANDSFNCVATKVIITSKNWPQRRALIDEMKKILATIPPRHAWYPGADQRYKAFLERYKQAETVGVANDADELPWAMFVYCVSLTIHAYSHSSFSDVIQYSGCTDEGRRIRVHE